MRCYSGKNCNQCSNNVKTRYIYCTSYADKYKLKLCTQQDSPLKTTIRYLSDWAHVDRFINGNLYIKMIENRRMKYYAMVGPSGEELPIPDNIKTQLRASGLDVE
ncbi:Hypothetical protein ORPV_703 [Orpheovirus IHUMI-LCC2]|uniref:Uncharacterized protein n=1 Tax=Orpheovirus IHUMI-LCC2 TaxID=2023057 RepID=A0A2I2L505_9VIRU|nr:Hypothetical protein ORPV_703 [Orpheovirus IHUMI-LCC2]SNW62607.1 Hypothetical protein ORPV_703 [Orpheovirus IHUMI-LCC2]